jgi:uncharacterized cupredoxin-like copper-binding protein
LVIENTGTAPLLISSITTGSAAVAVNNTSLTVQPGETNSVEVAFTPTSAGEVLTTLSVVSNASGGVARISVAGTGNVPESPKIDLSGDLEFGAVTVGATTQKTFTIRNTGTAPLVVSEIRSNDNAVTVSPTSARVSPSDALPVTVTFAPTAAKPYSGSVTVVSNASSASSRVSVSGTGATTEVPVLSLSGDLEFGAVTVGATTQKTFTIRNTGTAPLVVSEIRSNDNAFTVSPTAVTVTPSSATAVTVAFTPAAAKSYNGSIVLLNNGVAGTSTVRVSGSGAVVGSRVISISPATLDFGSVGVGVQADKYFSISNTGDEELRVTGVTSSNAVFVPFQTTGSVQPGKTENFTVLFKAASAGTFSGTIAVTSNATAGANTLAATARATVGAVVAVSGNLSFGNVPVNTEATKTLTVRNSGDSAFDVTGITSSDSAFSLGFSRITLAPGTSNDWTVRFKPTAASTYSATIQIQTTAPSGAASVSASGTGLAAVTPTRVIRVAWEAAIPSAKVGTRAYGYLRAYNDGNSVMTCDNNYTSGSAYVQLDGWNFPIAGTRDIGPGQYATFNVLFMPGSAGTFSGTVTIGCPNATSGSGTISYTAVGTN